MNHIGENLGRVRSRIDGACAAAGRAADAVTLIAVSKTFDAAAVRAAAAAGQRAFGENYVQEALAKQAQLQDLDLAWHFIGPLQSNKTRAVAEHFDWVHSVDRLKIAERLSQQRPQALAPLQVCVQVNISGEHSKSGCATDEAAALCRAVAQLPRLRLRGLMAIPAPTAPGSDPRAPYRALRELFAGLSGLGLDTLSAGMSDDLEAAIAEGATMVRVGSALFGHRQVV
ncbi:MAG: YggS family pyridoxal phosphate-dependent enzyme [Sinimarinibacterium flocculans]|uniref:YggS family pyridoxal phosphate-dependent enzyme n=1 Tax=Sinimarinibacterium flocculans TaxID=985250 RepID=UPI003C3EBE30